MKDKQIKNLSYTEGSQGGATVLVRHPDGIPALWVEHNNAGSYRLCDDNGSAPIDGTAGVNATVKQWKECF